MLLLLLLQTLSANHQLLSIAPIFFPTLTFQLLLCQLPKQRKCSHTRL